MASIILKNLSWKEDPDPTDVLTDALINIPPARLRDPKVLSILIGLREIGLEIGGYIGSAIPRMIEQRSRSPHP